MATGAESMPETVDSNNDCKDEQTGSSKDKPTVVIILGMAGSGKTTFVQVCDHPTFVTCTSVSGWKCNE